MDLPCGTILILDVDSEIIPATKRRMTHSIAKTKSGEIEFRSTGKGTPILFIHGGHSNCNETLSHKGFDTEQFHLITPSRPGYGKTPLGANKSPKQAADLFVALMDHLSLDQVIVYGISAGGLTALELAALYPQRVKKLIMASAISKKWLDENGKIYKAARVMFNPRMERLTWGMVRFFSKVFPGMIARSFYPQFSKRSPHKLNREDIGELLGAMKYYNSGSGFLNDIDQSIDDHTLGRVKCPTLIVHSENDNSVDLSHALHAHEMIKDSRLLKLVNEWGHLFWIGDDAGETIERMIEFIRN